MYKNVVIPSGLGLAMATLENSAHIFPLKEYHNLHRGSEHKNVKGFLSTLVKQMSLGIIAC